MTFDFISRPCFSRSALIRCIAPLAVVAVAVLAGTTSAQACDYPSGTVYVAPVQTVRVYYPPVRKVVVVHPRPVYRPHCY
jgi:hypothetical protein